MAKKIAAVIISVSMLFFSQTAQAVDEDEQAAVYTSAQAAALYCVDTGEFLYVKNPDERLPMASTTKIMTSLVALEQAEIDDKVVVFQRSMTAEGSSMGLKYGDKLRLSDLAAGMMTVSGNDAANAAAIGISGSFEEFAKLMNQRAKALGLKNTNFVTPSGLDDEEHYSSAGDMAKLMEAAMENDDFRSLVKEKSVQVDFIYPEDKSVSYQSHNKLLKLYEYCTGGKTGYTSEAGRCLVTSAERDGKHLIAVTLNSGDDWNDHIRMFDYGFSILERVHYDDTVFSGEVPTVGGVIDNIKVGGCSSFDCIVKKGDGEKVVRTVELPHFLYAPIRQGDTVGRIVYTLDGKVIASNDIIAEDDCPYFEKGFSLWESIGWFFGFG